MKNKWKLGFLILLGIDLLVVVILFILLQVPASETEMPKVKASDAEYVPLLVQSNKKDLNKLINHYLKKEAADSPVDYMVHLGDEVELYGTIPFFSQQLNTKLTFEPEALTNGDLVLKQRSISIGSMHLPVAYVLKIIRDNYKLPPGFEIKPNNKLVYIHMQNIKLNSGIKVKANKFDLKKDNIAITLLVPAK
jgi:uncharacterized protein YpmS